MIVFLSDNGWMQGEHRIPGDKFLPYEESLRVPLVIRGPGRAEGPDRRTARSRTSTSRRPWSTPPNAKAGRTMDGVSLLPTIHNPKRRPNRALEIEALEPLFANPEIPVNGWDRPYTGVRTDRYTYVVWTETGEMELYDRKVDPVPARQRRRRSRLCRRRGATWRAKLSKLARLHAATPAT